MGFFQKMYYGNPNKPDKEREDFTNKRFKLFFTVLSVRLWNLFGLNFLATIFFIPFLLVLSAELGILISQAENNEVMTSLPLLFFVPIIISLVIASPGLAGLSHVLRIWARDEHAWPFSDFKEGIKKNWKQAALVMLINGLVVTLVYAALNFYSVILTNSTFYYFLRSFMFVILGLFLIMNLFLFPLMVTYKLKLKELYKNALLLSILQLPRNILFTALVFGWIFAVLYLSIIRLPLIPFMFLALSIPLLAGMTYAQWVFDKHVKTPNQPVISAEDEEKKNADENEDDDDYDTY